MLPNFDNSRPLLLAEHPILFVDCQTTGANPDSGALLEIAWFVGSAQSDHLDQLQSRIVAQPQDKPVPYRIQAITGITEEVMAQAVDIDVVRSEFLEALTILPPSALCMAHFARFEHPFLKSLLEVVDGSDLPFRLMCTYEIAKRLYPNLPSKGIRAVAGFFGTTCGELKRSSSHVESTLSIWKGIVKHLEGQGILTYEQLDSWLSETPTPKRTKYEYPLNKAKRLCLPDEPGVYRMLSRTGTILYVGKATSLKQRVNSYFRGQRGKDTKTRELLSQVYDLRVTVCASPLESALLEADEIKRWDPPYNRVLKRGRRSLVFYSPDFSSFGNTQSEVHPIGPFAGEKVLEPLLKLNESLKSNDFIADIFFYEIPKSILAEGFEIFCINEGLERTEIRDARGLLALGLWLHRKDQRLRAQREKERLRLEAEAASQVVEALVEIISEAEYEQFAFKESDTSAEEPIDAESTEVQDFNPNGLTPEELGDKYARALRRMARMYLRSKDLTKLLHSAFTVQHKDVQSRFIVTSGQITSNQAGGDLSPSAVPWSSLDLDTYDRMSVLLSQVNSSKTDLRSLEFGVDAHPE